MKFISSIAGFGGASSPTISLACFLDAETQTLVVLRPVEQVEEGEPTWREQGFGLVTSDTLAEYDLLFTEDLLSDSVSTYFSMAGADSLLIEDECRSHDPANKIRTDGVDERGLKFKFSDKLGNGTVAILAACMFAKRALAHRAATDFTRELMELTAGLDEPGLYSIRSF